MLDTKCDYLKKKMPTLGKKNYNEESPHTGQNGHRQKSLQITNAGKHKEKREPSYPVGGTVNWCSQYGEQCGVP